MAITIVRCLIILIIIQIKATVGLNNRDRSPIPPLSNVEDIPMFLTITFDAALFHVVSHPDNTELILDHVNRNGAQIPLVYFVSNEYSDYELVQARYLEGCEIATNTVSRTTSDTTDVTQWYHEILSSRELISVHADIPINKITGFRAPFLKKSNTMFQVLTGLTPSYVYDSTIISDLDTNGDYDWPYTLDQYESTRTYEVGQGPQQSFPAFWEIPMYKLYTDIPNRAAYGIMDYEAADYDAMLTSFKNNFLHRMATNKAPMGLYFSSTWLDKQDNVDAINDFIDWVLSQSNTWIVTNQEIIDWINNPVPNSQYTFQNTNQLMNNQTSFKSCYYSQGIFKTAALSQCPSENPHSLVWDASVLTHSNIIITSAAANILSTASDVCSNDAYAIYDPADIYCQPQGFEVARYNDALYKCKWWTQGEQPDDPTTSWAFQKDCISYTESFIQADIAPYGSQLVFTAQTLEIDVTFTAGYILDAVSVFVDNNYHDLTIFDDYELDINAAETAAKLTLRFAQITHAEFRIEFSFQSDSRTLMPSATPTAATISPTPAPTAVTINPSRQPTQSPSFPTVAPTLTPSHNPTGTPSLNPTVPTVFPSSNPSSSPTRSTASPSQSPSSRQSQYDYASVSPSVSPSESPLANTLSARNENGGSAEQMTLVLSTPMLVFFFVDIVLVICMCVVGVRWALKKKQQHAQEISDLNDALEGKAMDISIRATSIPSAASVASIPSPDATAEPPSVLSRLSTLGDKNKSIESSTVDNEDLTVVYHPSATSISCLSELQESTANSASGTNCGSFTAVSASHTHKNDIKCVD